MKAKIFALIKNGNPFALGMLCIIGFTQHCHAQGTLATATISGQPSGNEYDYTITLTDVSLSTSLETFWFGWVPGKDFLPTSPTSVTPPTGWRDSITGGGSGDGYAIEFTTTSAALTPGSSLMFNFVSADTPGALAGNSPDYPSFPATTSFVYSGGPFVGSSQQFTVSSVPEPSIPALLGVGAGLLWFARRKGPMFAPV